MGAAVWLRVGGVPALANKPNQAPRFKFQIHHADVPAITPYAITLIKNENKTVFVKTVPTKKAHF